MLPSPPAPVAPARGAAQAMTMVVFALVLSLGLFVGILPSSFRAALFPKNPLITPPATGLFIHRGYEALPNERGSVLLEAGQSFTDFEALNLTFVVDDSARGAVLRVRRTAVTQDFEISTDFSAPGVVHVALVGPPRAISAGQSLLEFELDLANNSVNTLGNQIELRLLDVTYLVQTNQVLTLAHDGLITFVSNQDALTPPFTPFIADIDPTVAPLVQSRPLVITGQAFPPSPRVLLGTRSIPVTSASPTTIVARIPEDTPAGTYTVSVESLLADEKVIVFDAPGPTGSVDILEELLFFTPNPVLYNSEESSPEVVLWVPIFNPLGSDEPVHGSVDLSDLGGSPNVTFSGVGRPALGPGGVLVNWFRIPQDEGDVLTLPENLETNVDYPVAIRVENQTSTRDDAVALLKLRAQTSQGSAPSFGTIETSPPAPMPGDKVRFIAEVTDQDGIPSVSLVHARLTPIRRGVEELKPVFAPSTVSPPTTMLFATGEVELPTELTPGPYVIEFTALDDDGNETQANFTLIVSPLGTRPIGSPPQFSGRLEASPMSVRPGGTVQFFASILDPDGTNTIDLVTADVISIGGAVVEMEPTVETPAIGTLPLIFQGEFTLPTTAASGSYLIPIRAVDVNGMGATASIPLSVNIVSGAGGTGSPPEFSGRLEASPAIAPVGGNVSFFVGVRDADGTSTIRQVTIDLVSVRGSVIEMEPTVPAVPGSTQSVVYTTDFRLPGTVTPGVYALQIRATDAQGNSTQTTLPLTVSATTSQGGFPIIVSAFASPDTVPPDGQTETFFTVEVEDSDGFEDIQVVSINLSPIDLGILLLERENDNVGQGASRTIYTSDRIRVPRTVSTGGYDLTVEAEDGQRNRVQRIVRLTVGRTLGGGAPSLRASRFVPDIVRPGSEAQLFLEVQDDNGIDTVTVIADFTPIRGSVEQLEALIDFPAGTLATQNTFASDAFDIPDDLPQGVYDIPITVIDSAGNTVTGSARLRVERAGADEGRPPHIDTGRSFQSPRVLVNDGETKGEIHILVSDTDDDVLTVIANLGSLGYATSASRRDGIGDIALLCSESRSLACMQPGIPEGTAARWFILKDVVIPATTLPSTDPYFVEFTAVDAQGHTDHVRIPVQIGGPETEEALRTPPRFLAVVPVDEDELELILSAPVQTATIDRGGGQFVIQPTLNAQAQLRVTRVSWDTTGRLLYLETDQLAPGETYTLSAVSAGTETLPPLTDVHGNRFSKDQGGTLVFTAFARTGAVPRITEVRVVDPTHIDVRFATQVLPSSVHPDLLPSRVILRSTTTGEQSLVHDGELLNDARTLRLTVETLREGDRYELRIAGVLAPGLVAVPPPGAEKAFIARFPREGEDLSAIILPTADLNKDGKVDFADFALFSAVYNTEYSLEEAAALAVESGAPPTPSPEDGAGAGNPPRNAPPPPPKNPFGEIPSTMP